MALAEALSIGVRVAYLDRSEVKEGGGQVINWVEFGKDTVEESTPLTLLYRYVMHISPPSELMVADRATSM